MKTKRKLYCDACDTEFTINFNANKPISVCPFCAEEIAFIDDEEENLDEFDNDDYDIDDDEDVF